MSSVNHNNRGHDLVKKYQTHLKGGIEKGDRSLVCRDEKLCMDVQLLLTKGDAQKILNLRGLESLTVMSTSLQAFPFKTGHLGLEKLSKAFEVLELAALNLYLYPWRKEYRFVKMFSGMFTHFIKPALTLQQAKELFGLLGYQPSSPNREEELALDSKPVPADFMLRLACAFFTARMECQLLLSTLGSVDGSVESVLQLIKEQQKGHSLHVALENTKRKLEATRALHAKPTGGFDPELDLYTDENSQIKAQADAVHTPSAPSLPPRSSYTQSEETHLTKPSYRDLSQSDRLRTEDTSQEQALCVSMLQCHIKNPNTHASLPQNPALLESIGEQHMAGDAKRQMAEVGGVTCMCMNSQCLFKYYCKQCNRSHSSLCDYFLKCQVKGHSLVLWPDEAGQQKTDVPLSVTGGQSKQGREKGSLRNHDCVSNSTSDFFWVCHSCQLIHDCSCINIQTCTSQCHNVQPSGILQPPQEVYTPKRHNCLPAGNCNNCEISHDCVCEHVENCIKLGHEMQFLEELGDSETPSLPIRNHQCCAANCLKMPELACLTCQVFHVSECTERWQCYTKHKTHPLTTTCVICSSSDIYTFCRYCCATFCNLCWYKNPMSCKCGKPFHNSSSV